MSTARTRTLREIAQLNPRAAQLEPEDEVAFVGMADLDDVSARTTSDTRRPYSEVSKGYTPFRNGDLLAAKITPCWQNGKIGVATLDVEHGVGSTEFHVIRPDDEVNPRYLLHFLRTPEVRETGTLRMTGSGGQRRVPLKFMSDLQVPLPQAEVQHRIASILDEADAIRTKRRAQLAHLDELPKALFHEMFQGTQWPRNPIGNVGKVSTGKTPPTRVSGMFGGPTPFITPGDLASSSPAARSLTREGAKRSQTVRDGATLVCCIGATIGKVGQATIASAFNQQINAIEWSDEVNDTFGFWQLRLMRNEVARAGASTTLPILPKSRFAALEIDIPPLALQCDFSAKVAAIDAERDRVARTLDADDELFAALQHRAFRGEL